jgi:hypothetical protein
LSLEHDAPVCGSKRRAVLGVSAIRGQRSDLIICRGAHMAIKLKNRAKGKLAFY